MRQLLDLEDAESHEERMELLAMARLTQATRTANYLGVLAWIAAIGTALGLAALAITVAIVQR